MLSIWCFVIDGSASTGEVYHACYNVYLGTGSNPGRNKGLQRKRRHRQRLPPFIRPCCLRLCEQYWLQVGVKRHEPVGLALAPRT